MNMSRYLYIFNYVLTNGIKRQGKYYLGELSAWHEIDGYTCYMGYKELTMSICFHGSLDFDYQQKETLNEFKLLINETIKARGA